MHDNFEKAIARLDPFRIVCGADISVVSFGPDRTEGTADDIRE